MRLVGGPVCVRTDCSQYSAVIMNSYIMFCNQLLSVCNIAINIVVIIIYDVIHVVNFAFANLRRRNSVVMGTRVTDDVMIFG